MELHEKSNGGTQQNLNLSIIKGTLVSLPSVNIQKRTVKYLDCISDKI